MESKLLKRCYIGIIQGSSTGVSKEDTESLGYSFCGVMQGFYQCIKMLVGYTKIMLYELL